MPNGSPSRLDKVDTPSGSCIWYPMRIEPILAWLWYTTCKSLPDPAPSHIQSCSINVAAACEVGCMQRAAGSYHAWKRAIYAHLVRPHDLIWHDLRLKSSEPCLADRLPTSCAETQWLCNNPNFGFSTRVGSQLFDISRDQLRSLVGGGGGAWSFAGGMEAPGTYTTR